MSEKAATATTDKWDAQLRKGTLELAILAALKTGPLYGLALLGVLHQYDTLVISEGTLYPLMDRLKRDGVITATWVQEGESRPRKYYALSEAGEHRLTVLQQRWQQTTADINSILALIDTKA